MKRLHKTTAWLLSLSIVVSLVPTALAVENQQESVKAAGLQLLDTVELRGAVPEYEFVEEPSKLPPEIPEEGFLLPLDEPLKKPDSSGLMTGFDGPEDGAVEITSVEQLLAISSGSYYLGCDLDLSGISDWTGITLTDTTVIDGQGYTITNLPGKLFAKTEMLTLRNLIVETVPGGFAGYSILLAQGNGFWCDNCTIRGRLSLPAESGHQYTRMGAFIGDSGYYTGEITNCAFFGTVNASTSDAADQFYVGGIAGAFYGPISDCYVEGSITGGQYVGGILGSAYSSGPGAIHRSQAVITGALSGNYSVGGILGYGSYSCPITDCCVQLREGVVIAQEETADFSAYLGGIAGLGSSISNCWARNITIQNSENSLYAGGIAGELNVCSDCYAIVAGNCNNGTIAGIVAISRSSVTDCAAEVCFSGNAYVCGGIVGRGSAERCRATGDLSGMGDESDCGGISSKSTTVKDCLASVDGAYAGIVYSGTATNCCVYGNVSLRGPGILYNGTAINCSVCNVACKDGGIAHTADRVSGCVVKNTTVVPSTTLAATADVGGIARGCAQVSNCQVTGSTIRSENGIAAGVMVGIAFTSGSVYNCVVKDTVVAGWSCAGGVVGQYQNDDPRETFTITDCVTENITVTASVGDGSAGGILGRIPYGNVAILACQADGDIQGYYAGGVLGSFDHGVRVEDEILLQSCSSSGSVYGMAYSGGMIGWFYTDVQLNDCSSGATVSGEHYIGGLVGGGSERIKMVNCRMDGLLNRIEPENSNHDYMGGYMGGLLGSAGEDIAMNGCTFGGELQRAAQYTGGLVGSYTEITMNDCHALTPIAPTAVPDYAYVGGIFGVCRYQGGYAGEVDPSVICNSSCAGVDVSGTGVKVGGFFGTNEGGAVQIFEHCTVDGDIRVHESMNSPYVGGFGAENGNLTLADCWVNGDMVISYPVSETTSDDCVGQLVGYNKGTIYYYDSGMVKEAGDKNFSTSVNGTHDAVELVGYNWWGTLEKLTSYTYVGGADIHRPVIVMVYGDHLGGDSGFPLAGAKVTIGSYSSYTDSTGKLTLDCGQDVFRGTMGITIEKDGYGTVAAKHRFATNMSVYSATLRRLEPGKILITGGSVELTATKLRSMFSSDRVYFNAEDTNSYFVNVNIDWNDHEPDRVYLMGAESGKKVQLTPTATGAYGNVCFGSSFDVKERIQVFAVTEKDREYGVLENSLTTSWMVQPLEVHIVVEEQGDGTVISNGKNDNKFFLESGKIKFSLGDLVNCASSISMENGILTIVFKDEDSTKEQGNLFSSGDLYTKDSVSVSGKFSFPYLDPVNGKWSGSVDVGYNTTAGFSDEGQTEMQKKIEAVEKNLPIHQHIHTFYVSGVPCYVEAGVGMYGGGTLELYSSLEDMGIKATLKGGFTGKVEGGVGGAVFGDEVRYKDHAALEVKVGLFGNIGGEFKVVANNADDIEVDPTLSGSIGGKATVHLFFVDLEDQLTLGKFKWNKTGLEWFALGEEGELHSVDTANLMQLATSDEDWKLLGRNTPASGDVVLFADSDILIPDIIAAAETVCSTAQSNGSSLQILYYTADDMEVDAQQNAMKLYADVGSEAAVEVDGTDTSDHSPAASGTFVTWVDVKTMDEANLSDFLMGSEIAVSRYDETTGSFAEKVILSDAGEDSHVYAPDVSTWTNYSNGAAIVTWLRTEDVQVNGQLNLVPQETEVWYATYDGTAWSAAAKAATVPGTIHSLHANCESQTSGSAFFVDYQQGSSVYRITVNPAGGCSEPIVKYENANHYASEGTYYSWVNEKGLYLGNYRTGTYVSLNGALNETPAVAPTGRAAYWAIDNQIWCSTSNNGTTWVEPYLVKLADGYVHDLSVGSSTLNYVVDTEDGSALYSHAPGNEYHIEDVEVTGEALKISVLGKGSFYWRVEDEAQNVLLSNYQSGVYNTHHTVRIGWNDLPNQGTVTFHTPTDSLTFDIPERNPACEVTIEDTVWDKTTLQAYVMTSAGCSGNVICTLSDMQGELIQTWNLGAEYVPEALYLAELETGELPSGSYTLTVAVGNVSDTALVGYGSPYGEELPADVSIVSWEASGGMTEIILEDESGLLEADSVIVAAGYQTTGQMNRTLHGSLTSSAAGIWEVTLPEEVQAGWSIYALGNGTYAPLCKKLELQ